MSKIVAAMLVSAALVIGLVWQLAVEHRDDPRSSGADVDLHVYCAASNQAVFEQIRVAYENRTGRSIRVQYGPSQTLLAQLEIAQSGDLFLPADASYLATGKERGLVTEILPIATMQVGLAVKRGNPKGLVSLESLLSEGVRFVQANPDAAAVGMITRDLLAETGRWDAIANATDAFRGSVTEVANDVQVGAADAGIVYDAVLYRYPDLEFVKIAELQQATAHVSVGLLRSSQHPGIAVEFARFLTAPEEGLKIYTEHGFHVGTDAASREDVSTD